jgi:hypothetical protein
MEPLIKRKRENGFSLKGYKNRWAQEVHGAFRKVLCF